MRQVWLGVILAVLVVGGLVAFGLRGGWPTSWRETVATIPPPAPLASERAPEAAPPVPPDEVEEAAAAPPETPASAPRPRALPAEPASAPEVAGPSLEELMRVRAAPPPDSNDVDWVGRQSRASPAEAERKPRARIDYSRENVTKGVPMQDERRRTDVGVSVPVDPKDRLRVKGGVRVDERKVSEEETESEATPTVGVEVRF